MRIYSPDRYVSLSNKILWDLMIGMTSSYSLPMNPQPDTGRLASLTEPFYSHQHKFIAHSGRRLQKSSVPLTGIRGSLNGIPRGFLSPYNPGEILSVRESLKLEGDHFVYVADGQPATVTREVRFQGGHRRIAPAAMPIEAVRFLIIIQEVAIVYDTQYSWRYLIDLFQKISK